MAGRKTAGRKGEQHAANIMVALAAAPHPLGAYDLLERLRSTGVAAPPTVYRALNKLIAAGKVHRIVSLNAFVACRNHLHHHDGKGEPPPHRIAAFTICDRCGAVDEFVDADLFQGLEQGLGQRRFSPRNSAIEVQGRCGACAALV